MIVRAKEVTSNHRNITFKFKANHLDKKNFLNGSDPYFIIFKANGNDWIRIHTSETLKKTLNPNWGQFSINSNELCNSDVNLAIKFEVWDWNQIMHHELIGEFITNYSELKSKKSFSLINQKLKRKKGDRYLNSGTFEVLEMNENITHTFFDYITGGTSISLVTAIDFTGSNLDPKQVNSLHYINPNGTPNEYMAAIRIIGDVLAPYDSDHLIPTFGFGAEISNKKVNHCFPLNSNEKDPNVVGVDGILQSYCTILPFLTLSGPTHFAPIIKKVKKLAKAVDGGENYYILLIITDGVINDMDKTLKIIKECTDLPISIVIVGVGNADFSNMEELDDDEGELGFPRDIVQFVQFRKFTNLPLSHLSKETLEEIPQQLCQFMKLKGIVPKTFNDNMDINNNNNNNGKIEMETEAVKIY